jgi:hypothetical protein
MARMRPVPRLSILQTGDVLRVYEKPAKRGVSEWRSARDLGL